MPPAIKFRLVEGDAPAPVPVEAAPPVSLAPTAVRVAGAPEPETPEVALSAIEIHHPAGSEPADRRVFWRLFGFSLLVHAAIVAASMWSNPFGEERPAGGTGDTIVLEGISVEIVDSVPGEGGGPPAPLSTATLLDPETVTAAADTAATPAEASEALPEETALVSPTALAAAIAADSEIDAAPLDAGPATELTNDLARPTAAAPVAPVSEPQATEIAEAVARPTSPKTLEAIIAAAEAVAAEPETIAARAPTLRTEAPRARIKPALDAAADPIPADLPETAPPAPMPAAPPAAVLAAHKAVSIAARSLAPKPRPPKPVDTEITAGPGPEIVPETPVASATAANALETAEAEVSAGPTIAAGPAPELPPLAIARDAAPQPAGVATQNPATVAEQPQPGASPAVVLVPELPVEANRPVATDGKPATDVATAPPMPTPAKAAEAGASAAEAASQMPAGPAGASTLVAPQAPTATAEAGTSAAAEQPAPPSPPATLDPSAIAPSSKPTAAPAGEVTPAAAAGDTAGSDPLVLVDAPLPRPRPASPAERSAQAEAAKADAAKAAAARKAAARTARKSVKPAPAPAATASSPAFGAAASPFSVAQAGARGPTEGPFGAGGSNHEAAGRATRSNYQAQLFAHLRRFKTYPPEARSRGIRGTATVTFTVDSFGGVVGVSLSGRSGAAILDQEALAMVRRASPFPPIPANLGVWQMTVKVPIRFDIR